MLSNPLSTLLGAVSQDLPWSQILICVAAVIMLFKIISFQIGMIIKVIITIAILAAAVLFIQGM